MKYEEAVKRGKRLTAATNKVQWEWGDLALALAPMRRVRSVGQEPVKVVLKKLIADTECPYSVASLAAMRETAALWPPERRVDGVSFGVHSETRNREDRFDVVKPGAKIEEFRKLSGTAAERATARVDGDAHGMVPAECVRRAITLIKLARRRAAEAGLTPKEKRDVKALCAELDDLTGALSDEVTATKNRKNEVAA